MVRGKIVVLLFVISLVAAIPALAQLAELDYTGDLFTQFSPTTKLAGTATLGGDPAVGAQIWFKGTTLSNISRTSGAATAGDHYYRTCQVPYQGPGAAALGTGVLLSNWQPSLYEVYSFGAGNEGDYGDFNKVESPHKVLTIFPKAGSGLWAGGAVSLNCYDPTPNIPCPPSWRQATFGVRYEIKQQAFAQKLAAAKKINGVSTLELLPSPGLPSEMLWIDPFNPRGNIRVWSQNYKVYLSLRNLYASLVPTGVSAVITGQCWYQVDDNLPAARHFEMKLVPGGYGSPASVSFKVIQFPNTVIYSAPGSVGQGCLPIECGGLIVPCGQAIVAAG